MTLHIRGDAVKLVKEDPEGMLLHVANNVGAMGAGIALTIKNTFPECYEHYRKYRPLLGDYLVGGDGKVVTLVAQHEYKGYRGSKKERHLNYGALAHSLMDFLSEEYGYGGLDKIKTLYVPKGMGSALAGGDWEVVLEMVEFFVGSNFELVVVSYGSRC